MNAESLFASEEEAKRQNFDQCNGACFVNGVADFFFELYPRHGYLPPLGP